MAQHSILLPMFYLARRQVVTLLTASGMKTNNTIETDLNGNTQMTETDYITQMTETD